LLAKDNVSAYNKERRKNMREGNEPLTSLIAKGKVSTNNKERRKTMREGSEVAANCIVSQGQSLSLPTTKREERLREREGR
jgi:hypothetical protein